MKVYGLPLSVPTNAVRYVLSYLKIPFEFTPVDIVKGEQHGETYSKIAPSNKIPLLELDDGNTIFESNAICRYLADKAGASIYPKELLARSRVDSWCEFISHHVRSNGGRILFNSLFANLLSITPDERAITEGKSGLDLAMQQLERALNNRYLCGSEVTLADISLVASLEPASKLGISFSKTPKLEKLLANLMEEDFYRSCTPTWIQAYEGLLASGKA